MRMDMPEERLSMRPLPLPVPTYTHLPPHQPISPLSMSELPMRYEDQMDVERRPGRHSDIEVASTLAAMSGRPRNSTARPPASPAWSHSSLASDGTNESVKSENFVFTEDSSTWPSPMARCSDSSSVGGSFSSDGSEKSLPRLPELDHISLESLASHYASSSADRSRSLASHYASSSADRPHMRVSDYAAQATPRSLWDASHLPPIMHQHSTYHHHDYSSMKPKRKSPVRGTRCNIKYTIEQKDFVDYWRIDRHDRETPWDDVVREYNLHFKGPQRGSGGLQSAWYRENKKIPILDADGLLMFDENDEMRTTEVPVRAAKGRLHSIKAIGLLSTHPERALEYPWVTKEHKRRIWKTAHARQAQLEAAARRQRKRAEAESRLSRGHMGMLGAPELVPFHGPPSLVRPGVSSVCT